MASRKVRRIGTWHATRAGIHDRGLYLETTDVPWAERRYVKRSYMFFDDEDIRRLDRGEIITLDVDPEELGERIDEL